MAGALGATADAPAADKGAQAVPVPMQAPQPSPPALQPLTMLQRIDRLEEERRVRPKTSDASTSAAPQTDDQPDM
ncbi:hypothetical protein Tco_0776026 [Tanacetum coccineum]